MVAGLPDVAFDGSKSAYTVECFKEEIYPELSAADAACVDLFFLERDNANILKILRHGDAQKALRIAAVAAGIAVSRKGAEPSIPTIEEVLAEL